MTDTAKPIIGPWKIDPTDPTCVISGSLQSGVGDIVCLSPSEGGFEESAKHWEANASLIIEAGTVYHETGLTPRQLVEQRDLLLAKLRGVLLLIDDGIIRCRPSDVPALSDWMSDANNLIAKVEAKP